MEFAFLEFWETEIAKEMKNVRVDFKFLEPPGKPAPGYKNIPLCMICYIKMDFMHNARLVSGGGGYLTDPPSCLTYISGATKESVWFAFLIDAVEGYDGIAADVQNEYVQATSLEKYYGEDKRKKVLIIRDFCGLKSSGSSWRAHIAHTLPDMNFVPSLCDTYVWMRQDFNQMTKISYWEYSLVYVDDLHGICLDPRATSNTLETDYNYVINNFGPPTHYMRASIVIYDFDDHTQCLFMSTDQYLVNSIAVDQGNLQKHNSKLNSIR
jgi:uncharacterized protein Usg